MRLTSQVPRRVRDSIIYLQTDVLMPGLSKGLQRFYSHPEEVFFPQGKSYAMRYLPQERYDMVYLLTWTQQNVYQMTDKDKRYALSLLSSTGLYSPATCAAAVGYSLSRTESHTFFPEYITATHNIIGDAFPVEASGFLLEALRPDKGIRHKLLVEAMDKGACPATVARILGMSSASLRYFLKNGVLGPTARGTEKDLYGQYTSGVSGQSATSDPEHLRTGAEVRGAEERQNGSENPAVPGFPTCRDYAENPLVFRRAARRWFSFHDLPFVRVQAHVQGCRCSDRDQKVAAACSEDGGRTLSPEKIRFMLDYPDSAGVHLQVLGDVAQG